jgi:hypothetical protein
VVDRQQLNTIRAELEFQTSGEVDDDTAQALGRMAGAQIIVSGAISRIGDLYRLRVRALSVQSAEIEGQFNRNIPDGPTVAALVRSQATGYGGVAAAPSGSGAGSGTAAAASVATLAQAQVPAQSVTVPVAPVYKIGDTGPAGGLIFYDKFSAAGGWRYLETAPQETEQELAWGRFANFDGTTTAIGGGKRNTELVVQAAKNLVTAARFCSDLEYGGYDDWFLPSKDELDLIYKNLKDKNLGSFSGDIYWSSSYSGGWDSGPWRQSFGDGNQRFDSVWTGSGGSNTYRVRAIRQF